MKYKARRISSLLLSQLMISVCILSSIPYSTYASVQNTLTKFEIQNRCPVNEENIADEIPEADASCRHKHTDECISYVNDCRHEHTRECYPEDNNYMSDSEAATPTNAGKPEPENCSHVCDTKSGCIKSITDCSHEHDDNCGYQPASKVFADNDTYKFGIEEFAAGPTLNAGKGRIYIYELNGKKVYAQLNSDKEPRNSDFKEYSGTLTITGTGDSHYSGITVKSGNHNIIFDNLYLTASSKGSNDDDGFSGLMIENKTDVTLTLLGDNTIKGSPMPSNEESAKDGITIGYKSSLTVKGEGSLRAEGGNTLRTKTGLGGNGVTVSTEGTLTVGEGVSFTLAGGNSGVTAGAQEGYAMELGNDTSVKISNAVLSLEGLKAVTGNGYGNITLEGSETVMNVKLKSEFMSSEMICTLEPGDGYFGKLTDSSGQSKRVEPGKNVHFSVKGEGHLSFTDETHRLTVKNGTGSGDYEPGKSVEISAGAPPSGKTFRYWKKISGDGVIADKESKNTSFTMGWEDAEISADYAVGQILGDFLVITDETDGLAFENDESGGLLSISGSGTYTVKMADGKEKTDDRLSIIGKAVVILDGVHIENSSNAPVTIGRYDEIDNITLKLSGVNILKAAGPNNQGLKINTNYNNTTSLTVTGLSGDGSTDGELRVSSDGKARVTAFGSQSNPAKINIKGGTINVTSNCDGISPGTKKSAVVISGGSITARTFGDIKYYSAICYPEIEGEAAVKLNDSYIDISKIGEKPRPEINISYDTGSSSVTSVTIDPPNAELSCGGSLSFTAYAEGGEHADKSITWSVSGDDNGTGIDQNGKLSVSRDQTPGDKVLKVTAANEYSGKSASALVTVTNKIPSSEQWPTAETITYGQALSESNLIGGSFTYDGKPLSGTFSWKDASVHPDAGTAEHTVIFTPADNGYASVEGRVTVNVKKANLKPVIAGKTTKYYDGTTSAPDGIYISLEGKLGSDDVHAKADFSYNSPNVKEAHTINAENIALIGNDADNYVLTFVSAQAPGAISKASAPSITWPAADSLTYGQKLSESHLQGGGTEYGSFAWRDPDKIPDAGSAEYSVRFIPDDATVNNYEELGSYIHDVTVNVKKAETSVVLTADLDNRTSGISGSAKLNISITGVADGVAPTGNVVLTVNGESKTLALTNGRSSFTLNVRSGCEYAVHAAYSGDFNYNASYGMLNFRSKSNDAESSGGDSSDSGSSGNLSSSNPGCAEQDEPAVTIESKAPTVNADSDGNASIDIAAIRQSIDNAAFRKEEKGSSRTEIGVIVPVDTEKTPNAVRLIIKKEILDALVKANVKSFTIDTDSMPDFIFARDTLKALDLNTTGDIILKLRETSVSSADAGNVVGTRPVYDISLWHAVNGDETELTGLYDKSIGTFIPYSPAGNEQSGNLSAVSVDSLGKTEWITISGYNSKRKAVSFRLNRSGVYGIGYNTHTPVFADIENHPAKEDILFAAGRGLIPASGSNTFNPAAGITGGMFVTALGKLAGINPYSLRGDNSAALKIDSLSDPYLSWAVSKGIVYGTGFEPDKPITREQAAVILKNYAVIMDFAVPKALKAVAFADTEDISPWARESAVYMQQAGIIAEKDRNKYAPKELVSKAELAMYLRRFTDVVIDPQTADIRDPKTDAQ